jgi:hypothetical protein
MRFGHGVRHTGRDDHLHPVPVDVGGEHAHPVLGGFVDEHIDQVAQ